MVRFELKKVFSRFKNKMAVVILCVLMIVVSLLTMNRVYYSDENGNHTSGMQAAKSLREEKNQWRGYVTDKVLKGKGRNLSDKGSFVRRKYQRAG